MTTKRTLELAIGFATTAGQRSDNQDFGGVDLGSPGERELQGVIAVVADGVGGARSGRIAAELAVGSFIEGYRAQNPLAGIATAAMKAMDSYNLWLHGQAQSAPDMKGAATTFTSVVLRGREATVLHVGDSRAWHYRSGVLTCLTDDHVAFTATGEQILLRAVGLEPRLRLDVRKQGIVHHDRILIASDGVHSVLGHQALSRLIAGRGSSQADADSIVATALKAGTRDNATALVIDVVAVPSVDHDAIAAEMDDLPLQPPPEAGQTVDGFRLERVLAESHFARLFIARDGEQQIVLKFPKTILLSERSARLAFMREAFLGRRVESPFVGGTIALAEGRQSRLYVAMPYHAGESLEARITRGPMTIADSVMIGIRIARGLVALHRLGIAHRDVKPENVLLTADGGLKIIDLGVASLPRFADFAEAETPGTASFMAPELFDGHGGDACSDQFSFGVTLYRMLTGRYPYGEAEPGSRPLFGPPVPASRYRLDLPAWLDAAAMRAVALRRDERFADMDEIIHDLETGSIRGAPPRKPLPLIQRLPVRVWQGATLLLFLALIAALAMR
jgi:serine/threonine protein phosphatase PrpC